MKEDENFDTLIRNKFESRSFGFNESSWAAAQAKIAAQRRAKTIRKGLLGGLIVALLFTGAWFLVFPGTGKQLADKPQNLPENENVTASGNTGQENDKNKPGNTAGENNNTVRGNSAQADQQSAAAGTSTGSDADFVNNPAKANNRAGDKNNTAQNSGSQKSSAENAGGKETAGKQKNNAPGNSASTAGNNKTKTGNSKNKSNRADGNTGSATANTTNPGTNKNGNAGDVNSGKQDPANSTGGNASQDSPAQTNASSGNPAGGKSDPAAAGTSTGDDKPLVQPSAASAVLAAVPDSTGMTSAEASGDAATGPANNTGKNKLPSNSYWFAQAGMQYMPGFTAGETGGRGLNASLAFGHSLGIGSRMRIEAALQYAFLGHASDSSRIYTTTTYSFGADISKTEIGLSRLHYAGLPIQLRYAINDKHAFFIAATPSYMFTAESEYRTYTLSGITVQDIKTKRAFGYNQGLHSFDCLLGAGYSRAFGRHFEGQVSFHHGLRDIKDNAYFRVDKNELNKHIQFAIRYNF
ncbi:MAG: hypothetical protein FD123_4379 [Bacteroidetes bacterium]|nr:MAG: hypothetical protein FD123_4379 [Bacteroidota bacterium]